MEILCGIGRCDAAVIVPNERIIENSDDISVSVIQIDKLLKGNHIYIPVLNLVRIVWFSVVYPIFGEILRVDIFVLGLIASANADDVSVCILLYNDICVPQCV